LVEVGLTTFEGTTVVKAASLYQVRFPDEQVAVSSDSFPSQIVVGLAAMAVGEFGVSMTETLAVTNELAQVPVTHTA
jgi:hypothetical protein